MSDNNFVMPQINVINNSGNSSGINGKFKVKLSFADITMHMLWWIILITFTLGIALVFYPYYLAKFVLNNVEVYSANGNILGKVKCTISAWNSIGHILVWLVVIVFTCGLALPYYMFNILQKAINTAEVK